MPSPENGGNEAEPQPNTSPARRPACSCVLAHLCRRHANLGVVGIAEGRSRRGGRSRYLLRAVRHVSGPSTAAAIGGLTSWDVVEPCEVGAAA